MKKIYILFFSIFLFICGCSNYQEYIQQNILPQYIKKIYITKFEDPFNKSSFQDKLYFTIKDKFTLDRRVDLSEEKKLMQFLMEKLLDTY